MDKLDLVSKKIKLKVNDEVSKKLSNDWHKLEKQILDLKSIDTDGINPMVRIDPTPESFLREDIPSEVLDKKFILDNAPEKDDDFIIISKVVGND